MRNIWTIAARELKAYYTSPIGYVVLFCWMFFAGVIFSLILLQPQAYATMDPLFRNNAILLVFILPLLTMRLLAGERGGDQGIGTIELLLTSPITEWEMILGKYLGAMLYVLTLMAATLIYPLAMSRVGDLDWGPVWAGYIGFFFFCGYMLAFGLLMSALTNSQIVAAITSMVGLLVLWLVQFFEQVQAPWGKSIAWWSMMSHHEDFWRGVVTLVDVAWYLAFIFVLLYAAKQAIASGRWR